jgi:protein-S-isoprenylcysteine O-methyltransferase Ste14
MTGAGNRSGHFDGVSSSDSHCLLCLRTVDQVTLNITFSLTVLYISAGAITCDFKAQMREEIWGPGFQSFLTNRIYKISKNFFYIFCVIWTISVVQSRIMWFLFTEQIWFDVGDSPYLLYSQG